MPLLLTDVPRLATIAGVDWRRSRAPVAYGEAVAAMEEHVAAILDGAAAETIWLLEHPSVYTGGVSARAEEILDPGEVPVVATARGGRFTYHGPGQRVIYILLDLRRRGRDVHRLVTALEEWVIAALASLGVMGSRCPRRVGIWVRDGAGAEAKIAAVGLRLRRWVSYHGVAINVCPDLRHFDGIVPCGLRGHAVTSLAALGRPVPLEVLDEHLLHSFADNFLANLESPLTPRTALAMKENASTFSPEYPVDAP